MRDALGAKEGVQGPLFPGWWGTRWDRGWVDDSGTEGHALVIGDDCLGERSWKGNGSAGAQKAWEFRTDGLDQEALEDLALIIQVQARTASFVADDPEPCFLVGQR